MPEGDTLRRTADGLRPHLLGRVVVAARARQPGPRAELLTGRTIEAVEAVGKNLLVRFEGGLVLRTHLGMPGAWHRYRPGEAWRRAASRARIVLEVPGAVAVCFDAPTVELFEARVEPFHPPLARLGPDLLGEAFAEPGSAAEADAVEEGVRRLRQLARAEAAGDRSIAEALLDQRGVAGIGNIWKSETLWAERVDPFTRLDALTDADLSRLFRTAARLLAASVAERSAGSSPGRSRGRSAASRGVYGRAGRPCRRCGTPIRSRSHGTTPRTTYWCPRCQGHAS